MDEQQKRKVVLALVPVLVLGAGTSFWYFGHDSTSAVQRTAGIGPVERRERTGADNKEKDRDTRRVRPKREKATVRVRATREATIRKKPRRERHDRHKRNVTKLHKTPAG